MRKNFISIKDNVEYTFKKYTNIVFQKQSSVQSLFNGSIFESCEIDDSNFSKSDFEGTVWVNVSANNCILNSCDIKSTIMTSCNFVKCDFSLSMINNTTFKNCSFKDCILTEAIMNQNIFVDCFWNNISLDAATIALSRFENCNIISSILGNCSFYDHIMVNCKFEEVTINIDSIGRIYGLTKEDLQNFKYIFLGKTYGFAPDNFFQKLDSIFEEKKWRLQKILYLFNINALNTYDFVISIFENILFYIDNNIIVKHDELIFVLNILKQLEVERHLPLFAIYRGLELLNPRIETLEDTDTNCYNKLSDFNEFYNGCFLIFNSLLLKFSQENENLLSMDVKSSHYILEIHYESNKTIKFDEILNKFLKLNGYDESYYCQLLQIKKGSIIEVIVTPVITVFMLQLFLYGINGTLLQISDMVTKVQVIKNKKYRNTLLKNSIAGNQIQPEIVGGVLNLAKDKEVNKTIRAVASLLDETKIIGATLTNTTEENKTN